MLMALKSTPVLASRISGNVGMLGDDYDGYFELGDSDGLAALLRRCRGDGEQAQGGGHGGAAGFGTLLGALNGSDVVYAKAAAVYLNANATERAALKAVVYDGLEGAGYVPSVGAKPWHALEVEAYFNYLLGI